jgi:hypothetical protein
VPGATLVAEALRVWREAERVLETLPMGSPDHETARILIVQMHELYTSLTEAKAQSAERLASTSDVIQTARATLRAIRST